MLSAGSSAGSSKFQNKCLELLLCEALVQKEALTICHDRVFASFLLALSIIIISFRKFDTYALDDSGKTNKQGWGGVEDMKLPGLLKK